jgi:hypothetical protein
MVNETSDFEVPAKFRNDDLVRCFPEFLAGEFTNRGIAPLRVSQVLCERSNTRRLNNGKKSLVQFATRFR